MQKYFNTVTKRTGAAIEGASVAVTTYPAGAAAAIYSDDGITSIPGSIVTTDANGHFEFYAADGRYTLSISGPGITPYTLHDVLLLEDPTDDKASIAELQTGKASLADLASSATGKGSALLGHPTTGETVKAALDARLPEIGTYALLRAYTGPLTAFYVRGVASLFDGGAGVFRVDTADTTSADNGGTILVDAAGRRWKREFDGAADIRWFGADSSGISSSSAAIASALTAANDVCVPPVGSYRVTATISIPQRKRLRGAGYKSQLIADAVSGAVISITSGNGQTEVSGLRISGTATTGVSVNNAQLLKIDNISLDGLTATDGYSFVSCWASSFTNLWTNGATISNACFKCGAAFNANFCSNWYTSNDCTYSVLIDSDGAISHGSQWSMICCQSSLYGLYIRSYQGATISGVYMEDVVFPLRLGDKAGSRLARGISISGGDFGGPSSTNPGYSQREAVLWFDYAIGCHVAGADLSGALNCGAAAPVSFSGGGGSGAFAVARVTAAGVVHSVEVTCPGTGYTTDPTATVGGAGSGATLTVTRSGTTVGSIAVSAGGTGYTASKCPVVATYHTASKCSINDCFFNSTNGDNSPTYPWVVRRSGANSGSGLALLNDQSWRNGANGNSCELRKTRSFGYTHVLIEWDNAGTPQNMIYTPPQYP